MKTITAANSVFAIAIAGLFDTPQVLEGYSADAAFDTDAAEPAEVVMGVDGIMSAGFVPYTTKQTITLMPDSISSDLFEAWMDAQKTIRDVYYANATIILPAIQRGYTLTNGVLTAYPAIPGTRKVLQARNFVITWEDISPAPI